jgi:hypothetical protein
MGCCLSSELPRSDERDVDSSVYFDSVSGSGTVNNNSAGQRTQHQKRSASSGNSEVYNPIAGLRIHVDGDGGDSEPDSGLRLRHQLGIAAGYSRCEETNTNVPERLSPDLEEARKMSLGDMSALYTLKDTESSRSRPGVEVYQLQWGLDPQNPDSDVIPPFPQEADVGFNPVDSLYSPMERDCETAADVVRVASPRTRRRSLMHESLEEAETFLYRRHETDTSPGDHALEPPSPTWWFSRVTTVAKFRTFRDVALSEKRRKLREEQFEPESKLMRSIFVWSQKVSPPTPVDDDSRLDPGIDGETNNED